MSIELVERAITTIMEYMRENMQTYIDAVNEQYDDEATRIEPVIEYSWSERASTPPTPSVLILAEASTPEEETAGARFKSSHWIQVILVLSDQEEDILRRKMYRFMLAAWKCLTALRNTGGDPQLIWRLPYASYSPVYVNDDTRFFTDGQLNLDIIISEAV